MARVIQDSDDESDEIALEEHAVPPPTNTSMSVPSQPSHISPITQYGTGSTDSLRRAIEAAHRDQFHPGSAASAPIAQNGDLSPLGHRNKRRKTNIDALTDISLASQTKGLVRSYGQANSVHSSTSLEAPNNDADVEEAWDLQGTLRQDYEEHEPMALFPDPSSTIIDGTLTQQRLLKEVLAPTFLSFEAEIPTEPLLPPEPDKSSIPWSDFLKSSMVNSDDQASTAEAKPAASGTTCTGTQEHLQPPFSVPTPARGHTPRLSQQSRRGSSGKLKGSPLRNEIATGSGHTVIDTIALVERPTVEPLSPVCDHRKSPTSVHGTQGQEVVTHEEFHDSSKAQETSSLASRMTLNEQSKKRSSPVQISDDYSNEVDLPKEQYKPRPTRSRSLKVTEDGSVEPSVASEKTARKRSKRSKTIGEAQEIGIPHTPRRVKQICDMGFSPSTTQRALQVNDGDLHRTIDWLVNNVSPDLEDELAPSRSSQAKVKAKKSSIMLGHPSQIAAKPKNNLGESQAQEQQVSASIAAGNSGDLGSDHLEISDGDNLDTKACVAVVDVIPSKHPKVVIANGKARQSPAHIDPGEEEPGDSPIQDIIVLDSSLAQKSRHKETNSHMPDSQVEDTRGDPPSHEPQQPKKRGRGRPRKEHKTTKLEKLENEGTAVVPKESILDVGPLQEAELNIKHKEQASDKNVDGHGKASLPEAIPTTASTVLLETTSTPISTMKTPEAGMKMEAGLPSPLGKGNVSYRVGLSKRARIAPLLRVMKKKQ